MKGKKGELPGATQGAGSRSHDERLRTSEFLRLLSTAGWENPSPEVLCKAFEEHQRALWSVLYSVHARTGGWDLIAARNLPPTVGERMQWADLLVREVARTGLGISLGSTESESAQKYLPPGGYSILGLPLFIRGVITGAVVLGRSAEHPFSEEDIDDAISLSPLAALFLANLLFVKRLREQGKLLEKDREDLLRMNVELKDDLERLRDNSGQLERAFQELTESTRNRTEFFENISHELRTPLTPIIASSEALLGKAFGDLTREQREMIEMLFLSAKKLDLLIEDLVELVRLESTSMKLDLECVDLAGIVAEGIHEITLLAKDRKIDLKNEVGGEIPVVMADRKRLSQLFVNLLHNAIKFSHEGGEVRLALDRSREEAGMIGIRVTDRGIGIPPDALERIFDRFFQADNGRLGNGLGLGLAIVKRIAEAHRGEVRVQSELGKGSSFTVFLPIGQEKANR